MIRIGRCLKIALTLTGLVLLGAAVFGQSEHVTREPSYQGETASAPIPAEYHIKNEGGSDGAGLCVISSMLANGRYQQVPGLEEGKGSDFWKVAKSRPGGYGPDKLIPLIRETLPDEKYASLTNATEDDLDRLSRQGYPLGSVMGYGDRYRGQRISHMVSLIHYRKGGRACVVDNNFPGEYSWMESSEYLARFKANGSWAFLFTRLPAPVVIAAAGGVLFLVAALLALAAVKLLLAAGLLTAAALPHPAPAGD